MNARSSVDAIRDPEAAAPPMVRCRRVCSVASFAMSFVTPRAARLAPTCPATRPVVPMPPVARNSPMKPGAWAMIDPTTYPGERSCCSRR